MNTGRRLSFPLLLTTLAVAFVSSLLSVRFFSASAAADVAQRDTLLSAAVYLGAIGAVALAYPLSLTVSALSASAHQRKDLP
ncbi:hypothetical protein [Sphingosinicella sp. BN140058]|uniref:hypothetical protein n=1 Tax=Sphingosinicella sp. BN140058 TaxID=1892855 RepID=UPI001010A467|nr:hypothetical protein [Sphingosinicella sp. BN140058]QAY80257.1 hypothetical protein ETR14_26805 [Sphingosinicella sp. BN140058]